MLWQNCFTNSSRMYRVRYCLVGLVIINNMACDTQWPVHTHSFGKWYPEAFAQKLSLRSFHLSTCTNSPCRFCDWQAVHANWMQNFKPVYSDYDNGGKQWKAIHVIHTWCVFAHRYKLCKYTSFAFWPWQIKMAITAAYFLEQADGIRLWFPFLPICAWAVNLSMPIAHQ